MGAFRTSASASLRRVVLQLEPHVQADRLRCNTARTLLLLDHEPLPWARWGEEFAAHPWQITRDVTAPIQEPHVGLVIDTSGSMNAYEYGLGPICWILTDGLRQMGGRCATALFGNSVALLADGTRPLPLVPGVKTGGGTAFAGDAIELLREHLEMTNPRRPTLSASTSTKRRQ